jgi:hypothetical protein
MADAPDPIVSAPPQPGQPYDATDTGGDVAGWVKLDADDFPDGPGPWKQV